MMDSVPTLLKYWHINYVFVYHMLWFCVKFIQSHVCYLSHLNTFSFLCLITYFITFNLITFNCLNGRACIARLMFELFESLLESEQMRGDSVFQFQSIIWKSSWIWTNFSYYEFSYNTHNFFCNEFYLTFYPTKRGGGEIVWLKKITT